MPTEQEKRNAAIAKWVDNAVVGPVVYPEIGACLDAVDRMTGEPLHRYPSVNTFVIGNRRRQSVTVARLLLEDALGRPLTKQEVARHRCDRKCCINLFHLEPGSNFDNWRDSFVRGRIAYLEAFERHR